MVNPVKALTRAFTPPGQASNQAASAAPAPAAPTAPAAPAPPPMFGQNIGKSKTGGKAQKFDASVLAATSAQTPTKTLLGA